VRVVGLITEYNPFHNGHLYHLQESLRVADAEASVAIMSGHFLQRGEPALVDKWVRTEMALAAGVDLVLELPVPFACNSAPHFAMGAVQSLQALGVVDALCFGSESGELALLQKVAEVLVGDEGAIEAHILDRLRDGVSYPAARAEALAGRLPELRAEEVAAPNNILGIEYLKALRKTASRITPFTIKRLGAGYHDTAAADGVASATGLRGMLASGEPVDRYMPAACLALLQEALQSGACPDAERFFVALQAHLLQPVTHLEGIYLLDEGFERRLALTALQASSVDELVSAVKSRQWTRTRIQRALIALYLQVRARQMKAFLKAGPLYLRLLGNSDKGRRVLAKARQRKSLPLVGDPARATTTLRKFYRENSRRRLLAEEMLQLDLTATQLYGLLQATPTGSYRNQDYYQPVRQV